MVNNVLQCQDKQLALKLVVLSKKKHNLTVYIALGAFQMHKQINKEDKKNYNLSF